MVHEFSSKYSKEMVRMICRPALVTGRDVYIGI